MNARLEECDKHNGGSPQTAVTRVLTSLSVGDSPKSLTCASASQQAGKRSRRQDAGPCVLGNLACVGIHKCRCQGCKHGTAKKLGDVTTLNLTMLRTGVSNDNGKTFCLNVIPTEAEAGFDVRITPNLAPKDFQALLDKWPLSCTWRPKNMFSR